MRRYFDGCVHAARGGAANEQRHLSQAKVVVFLHLRRHVLHLFQARRNQSGQADDVCPLSLGFGQNLMTGHHDPHVDHVKVIALQNDGDNVFTDVVHVALDRGNHDFAFGFCLAPGLHHRELFCFDVRQQMRHGLLHDPGTLDHLGQKHLALAKQVADHVHAIHERAFNHVQWPSALGQYVAVGLFGVHCDEIGDAMHQRMA